MGTQARQKWADLLGVGRTLGNPIRYASYGWSSLTLSWELLRLERRPQGRGARMGEAGRSWGLEAAVLGAFL